MNKIMLNIALGLLLSLWVSAGTTVEVESYFPQGFAKLAWQDVKILKKVKKRTKAQDNAIIVYDPRRHKEVDGAHGVEVSFLTEDVKKAFLKKAEKGGVVSCLGHETIEAEGEPSLAEGVDAEEVGWMLLASTGWRVKSVFVIRAIK